MGEVTLVPKPAQYAGIEFVEIEDDDGNLKKVLDVMLRHCQIDLSK